MNGETCGSGTIKSINLKNFMCHDNLEVNLNNGLNIITGSNGSGKSAILAGLMFVFGKRASSTSRANSFKEFVKSDKHSSSVSITLNNPETDGYHFERYGKYITVIRKVSKSSSTSYKLLSFNGTKLATSRKEVDEILSHFNIQVENPINILNQECTKTFLNSSDQKIKYKLFMTGTNLNELEEDYRKACQEQNDIKINLEIKRKSLDVFKHDIDLIKTKIQIFEDMCNIHGKIDKLKMKLIQCEINELLHDKSKIDTDLNNMREQKETLGAEIEKLQNFISDEVEQWQKLSTNAQELKDEIDKLNNRKIDIVKGMDEIDDFINKNQIRIEFHKRELESNRKIYNELNKTFNNIDCQNSIEAIQKLNNEKNQMIKDLEYFQNNIKICNQNIYKNKEEKQKLMINKNQLMTIINTKKTKLDGLMNYKNNLLIYGHFTINVLNEIQKTKFTHPPIGPLGSLIKSKNDDWNLSIEICIRSLINSYIVFNLSDKLILLNIFKKYCQLHEIPMIIITQYSNHVYDYELHSAKNTTYNNMLHYIDCKDSNAVNVLIDHLSIEKILCIPTISEARMFMIPNPPKNVNKVFTMDGDEILYTNGSLRFYSTNIKIPKYLISNISSIISALQNDITHLNSKLTQIIDDLNKFSSDVNNPNNLLEDYKLKESQILQIINKVDAQLQQYENNIEGNNAHDKTSIDNELNNIENKIKSINKQLPVFQSEIEDFESKKSLIESEYNDIKLQIQKIKSRWESTKNMHISKNKNITKLQSTLKMKMDLLNDYKEKENGMIKIVESKMEKIEVKSKLITNCSMSPINDSKQDILNEITRLEQVHKTNLRVNMNIEELKNQRDISIQTFTELSQSIKDVCYINEHLIEMISKREDLLNKFRCKFVNKSQNSFSSLLNLRKYNGQLIFNHTDKTLDIHVQPYINCGSSSNNIKTLSGGERSFSTLAFVISLWTCVESPFRCLDEFDVFMDVINRRTSLKLLLDYSQSHPNQQLILITPLDITDLSAQDITLFRLDNPRS